ncbi:hypothetical protein V502_01704 [Pseudogymnoascus sp. VKM F-4520 (FW-2644)]|nr:hypothetical protein V502_01704 [Pseudogymnoascus sp. VKM F-4520 (FW-2644)]
MFTFRNEKQRLHFLGISSRISQDPLYEEERLHFLRSVSSGPIVQDPRYEKDRLQLLRYTRNDDISNTSTGDSKSLEKEMERLRLQAQVNPKATATALAHRRDILQALNVDHYSIYLTNFGISVSVPNGSVET